MKKKRLLILLLTLALSMGLVLGLSATAYATGASLEETQGGTMTASQLKDAILNAQNHTYDGQGVTVDFSSKEDLTGYYYDNTSEKARQVYLFGDQNSAVEQAITIKNVKFTFNATTANVSGITHAQIYPYLKGDLNFENCVFDHVGVEVQAVYANGVSAVFKNCTFKNIPNNYAIKHVNSKNITVEGCLIENCGSGLLFNSGNETNKNETAGTILVKDNTFRNVSVTGTDYAEKDRGVIQFSASFNPTTDTSITITGNTFDGIGSAMRYLSQKGTFQEILFDGNTGITTLNYNGAVTLYPYQKSNQEYLTNIAVIAQIGDKPYTTLKDAVKEAVDGDTIQFIRAGTYEFNYNDVIIYNSINIAGIADNPTGVILKNTSNAWKGITINGRKTPGIEVTLKDLVVDGDDADGSKALLAAIACQYAHLTLENVTIKNADRAVEVSAAETLDNSSSYPNGVDSVVTAKNVIFDNITQKTIKLEALPSSDRSKDVTTRAIFEYDENCQFRTEGNIPTVLLRNGVMGYAGFANHLVKNTTTGDEVDQLPMIKEPPTASAITLGQSLAASTVSGTTDVPGTFAWDDNTIVPTLNDSETTEYSVTFKPEDASFPTAATAMTAKVKVKVMPVVAVIGENTYASLEAAIEAANAGEAGYTIKLLSSVNLAKKVSITKTGAIDLDGKTLTIGNSDSHLTGNADVTIKNGDIVFSDGITSTGDAVIGVGDYNGSANMLTFDNVHITGDGYASGYAAFYAYDTTATDKANTVKFINSTIELKNAKGESGGAFKGNTGDATTLGAFIFDHTSVTVTGDQGSSVVANANIQIKNGSEISITNNTLNDSNGINNSFLTVDNSKLTITGNKGRGLTARSGSTINITGSSEVVVSDNTEANLSFSKGAATVFLAEGVQFRAGSVAAANYDADTSVIDKYNNGVPKQADGSIVWPMDYVAQVGEKPFLALLNAIDAAYDGGTVTLLKDVTVEHWHQNVWTTSGEAAEWPKGAKREPVAGCNGLTIDGAGHVLTVNGIDSASNGNQLFYGSEDITVKNLTINCADGVRGIGLHSGTIEGVTFNMTGSESAIFTAGSKNGKHIEIKNCTFNTQSADSYGIYSDDEGRDQGAVISGNVFNTKRSIVLRGDMQFLNNTVNGAKGVTVAEGAAAVVKGNYFANATASRSINAYPAPQAVYQGNVILGPIELEDNKEYAVAPDFSRNYWGGSKPEGLPDKAISNSWYTKCEFYSTPDQNGALFALSVLTPVEITTLPTASEITYGQTLADSTLSGGVAKLGDEEVQGSFAWKTSNTTPAVSDSETTEYDVVFTPSDSAAYTSAECKVKLKVNKADCTVTAPTTKDLTYTGASQGLVNEGEVTGGKLYYALGTDTTTAPTDGWDEKVPTATNAGTYYVWYKVVGDENHNDTEPAPITVRIGERSLTITAAGASKTFDGTALTKNSYFTTGLVDGDRITSIKITGSITSAGSAPNTASEAVIKNSAGDDVTNLYDITYRKGTLVVVKKSVSVKADDKTKVYDNDPATDPELTATVTGEVKGCPVSYTLSREKGQAVGSYKITVTAGKNPNYVLSVTDAELTITDGTVPVYGEPDFTLPGAIKTIEDNAFEGGAMRIVYIPDPCTAIGAGAFKDCANLTQIRLPKNCAIGDGAFNGCGKVYVFAPAGGTTESWCQGKDDIVFVSMDN